MFMDAGGDAGVGGCLWNENGSLAEPRTLCCPSRSIHWFTTSWKPVRGRNTSVKESRW